MTLLSNTASPGVEAFPSPSIATDSNTDIGTLAKLLNHNSPSRYQGLPRAGRHAHTPIQVRRRSEKKAKNVHTFFTLKDGNSSCLFCEYVFPFNMCSFRSFDARLTSEKNIRYSRATLVHPTVPKQAPLSFESTFVTVMPMPG